MMDWFAARRLLVLALVTAASLLSVFALRSFHDIQPAPVFRPLPGDIDLALEELVYTKTGEGRQRWVLTARSADHALATGVTRVAVLRLVFFAPERADIVLTADQGEFLPHQDRVRVRGNVVLTDGAATVHTTALEYTDHDRTLTTVEAATITAGGLTATGTGLRIDTVNRRLTLSGRVQAQAAATD